MSAELRTLVAETLAGEASPVVRTFAARLAARYGEAARGVLFYGSSLRTGDLTGTLLDFYLLVDDYTHAYGGRWLAVANRLLPPNVFYAEEEIDGVRYRAKYAVLTLRQFHALAGRGTFNVSIWARFAQPSLLVWHAPAQETPVAAAVARAPVTLLTAALPLLPAATDCRGLWTAAFALTYGSELRAERRGKGLELYDLAPDYYRAITEPALRAAGVRYSREGERLRLHHRGSRLLGRLLWSLRSLQGKLLSALRLIKASATFDGGIDYLAWKITRHAGVPVEIKPWHRRHPIVGGLVLFWQLRRRGAVR